MADTKLPERTVHFRFPKSPDFLDPEYDQRNPEHYIRAWDQRIRERYVAGAEMLELQEQIRMCFLKSGVNAKEWCHDLGAEYMRRLKCPGYVCSEDERYKPEVNVRDYRSGTKDMSLEMQYQKLNIKRWEPKE